jgi:WhiB family transcriptional regulator, redox-sensing transcriptional regulator
VGLGNDVEFDTPLWMRKSFCKGANPVIFDTDDDAETAKAYCQRCFVRTECLEYAMEHVTSTFGIWGGTTEAERRAIQRGGHRRTCPGCRGVNVFSDGVDEICLSCGFTWQT